MSSSPARASLLASNMRSAGSADNVHSMIANQDRAYIPTPLANQNRPHTPTPTRSDRSRNLSANQKSSGEASSTPPPLPRKQSQVDNLNDPANGGYAQVRMRKHSHKGVPPPALPPAKPPLNDAPPALPQKRTSVGAKNSHNNHQS